jgi:Flavin containing amine oxidoreductase
VSWLLTEGRDRVGGNITTVTNDEGYLWEEGPNSFQPSDAMLKAAVSAAALPCCTACQRSKLLYCCSQWGDAASAYTQMLMLKQRANEARRRSGASVAAWLASHPSVHAQVDAGLDSELVLGDPKAPRFVFWNKELLPTPSGPDIATFKLLSVWGKIRAGLGALGFKQPMPGMALVVTCLLPDHVLAVALSW